MEGCYLLMDIDVKKTLLEALFTDRHCFQLRIFNKVSVSFDTMALKTGTHRVY